MKKTLKMSLNIDNPYAPKSKSTKVLNFLPDHSPCQIYQGTIQPAGHRATNRWKIETYENSKGPLWIPSHLANGPWNKSLNFIFPTKNDPKSLKNMLVKY